MQFKDHKIALTVLNEIKSVLTLIARAEELGCPGEITMADLAYA